MEIVSIKKATEDLKEKFNALTYEEFRIRKEHANWYNTDNGTVTFFIDKQVMSRGETITILQQYFTGKVIDGGFCSISPITFVWTTFELKKGKPKTL